MDSMHNASFARHNGESSKDEWSLAEILTVLRRGRRAIIASLLITLAAAALYSYLSRPAFEASALILVDSKATGGPVPLFDISGLGINAKILNELELLRSRSVAEGVARSLLQRGFLDSASHQRPIEIITGEASGVPAVAGVIVDRLMKAVEAAPIKETDLIRLTARAHSADEAALIANTYAAVYSDNNLAASRLRSKALREFLQSQVQQKQVSLDAAEQKLKEYMNSTGVVSLDEEAKKRVEQLASLEATRDALDVDISSREETLASLKNQLALQAPNVERAIGESNDAYIRLFQEQLARMEVERDMANVGARGAEGIYTDRLKEVDQQIAELRRKLQERTQTFVGSLLPADRSNGGTEESTGFLAQMKQRIIEQQIDLDGLKAKKKALQTVIGDAEREFNRIPAKSIEMARLQRARVSSEKLYLLVEEKYNEAAIAETSELGSVNTVDPALPPPKAVSPRPIANLGIGLLAGLVVGVVITLVRSKLDTRIRAPEDLKKLDITPVGLIHRMRLGNVHTDAVQRNLANGGPIDWRLVSFLNPLSPVAEGYRHLRTTILESMIDGKGDRPSRARALLLTSANPSEGKTTTAANLAVSFAQLEGRVLLIDADLRQPAVHKMFGLPKAPGLSDVLGKSEPLDAAINRSVLSNLDVLCSGSPMKNPAELLASRMMGDLLAYLRGSYAILLLDAPPALAVADPLILAQHMEGLLLVARAGSTSSDVLRHALERLKHSRQRAVGVVLNVFDLKQAYGSYSYGTRSAYGYYGYTQSADKESA